MPKLDVNLPKSAKIIFSHDLDDRDQDLFAVKVKGVTIDLGWYPAFRATGRFMVMVFGKTVDDELEPRFRTRSVNKVRRHIEAMANKYARRRPT